MPKQIKDDVSIAQSELRYRRLFESAQDGILILDHRTGLIEEANPFISELLGYAKDELLGKELWEIGFLIDKRAARMAFADLIEKGYIRYEDLPLKKKDGQIIQVEFVSNVYKVGSDNVIQCNIRDISDRLFLQRKLNETEALLTTSLNQMSITFANVIESRDPYTAGHQRRVADLSSAIAKKLNLSPHSVEGINMSAKIHDIGKIGIPAEVLTKPSALNYFEVDMLRNHVQAGYNIIKHINFPWNVAETVLQHHERLDGTGYPNGVKGDLICIEARIVAVADTIEAMSSDRPYRKGRGIDVSLEEIKIGSGKLFDEDAVEACLTLFKEDNYQFPS